MAVTPAEATGCKPVDLLRVLLRPAIASGIATAAFFVLRSMFADTVIATLLCLGVGFLTYLAILLLIDKKGLLEDWNAAIRILRRPAAVN